MIDVLSSPMLAGSGDAIGLSSLVLMKMMESMLVDWQAEKGLIILGRSN